MPGDDRRRILKLQKLGRFLSLLLKHRSVRFPIQLNAEGSASLQDVVYILKRLPNFRWATMADIQAVLDLPGPQRFELVEVEGTTLIRAIQPSHSTSAGLEPVMPPDQLLYGTPPERLEIIKNQGLQPAKGEYIQLAANLAIARSLAVRITPDPLILHIDAAGAYAAGCHFYSTVQNIYLVDAVPLQYIEEFQTN
ncbi:MAG: RNA 2'-phosphotransferase [Anaerolineae bacterium]|nr:RNA 2'-phosphotransferase [Anaerolineae bacterium]